MNSKSSSAEGDVSKGYSCPLGSSIGSKFLVACTGLFLYFFVVVHLLGNLQMFLGQDAMNAYAKKLKSMPVVLWPARIVLLTLFTAHVVMAVRLAVANRRARPVAYSKKSTVQATWASRTMVPTGMIILAFVLFHLAHFTLLWIHPEYAGLHDAKGRHDVYAMVILGFRNPVVSGIYFFAMVTLALHLRQAFPGMFQSFGMVEGKALDAVKRLGLMIAGMIFLGYVSIPAAVLVGAIRLPAGVVP